MPKMEKKKQVGSNGNVKRRIIACALTSQSCTLVYINKQVCPLVILVVLGRISCISWKIHSIAVAESKDIFAVLTKCVRL